MITWWAWALYFSSIIAMPGASRKTSHRDLDFIFISTSPNLLQQSVFICTLARYMDILLMRCERHRYLMKSPHVGDRPISVTAWPVSILGMRGVYDVIRPSGDLKHPIKSSVLRNVLTGEPDFTKFRTRHLGYEVIADPIVVPWPADLWGH